MNKPVKTIAFLKKPLSRLVVMATGLLKVAIFCTKTESRGKQMKCGIKMYYVFANV